MGMKHLREKAGQKDIPQKGPFTLEYDGVTVRRAGERHSFLSVCKGAGLGKAMFKNVVCPGNLKKTNQELSCQMMRNCSTVKMQRELCNVCREDEPMPKPVTSCLRLTRKCFNGQTRKFLDDSDFNFQIGTTCKILAYIIGSKYDSEIE